MTVTFSSSAPVSVSVSYVCRKTWPGEAKSLDSPCSWWNSSCSFPCDPVSGLSCSHPSQAVPPSPVVPLRGEQSWRFGGAFWPGAAPACSWPWDLSCPDLTCCLWSCDLEPERRVLCARGPICGSMPLSRSRVEEAGLCSHRPGLNPVPCWQEAQTHREKLRE